MENSASGLERALVIDPVAQPVQAEAEVWVLGDLVFLSVLDEDA